MVKNILLALLFVVAMVGCNNDDEIDLPRTYIPDDGFERKLFELGYDDKLDDYVLTEKIDTIRVLNLSRGNWIIRDLTGIEDFKYLQDLNVNYNNLTSLDLTNNLDLVNLTILSNELTSLNISKNLKLEGLTCRGNDLSELDVSQNRYLEGLN